MSTRATQETPQRRLAAWSVHLFTAFGTICTLGALSAIYQNDIRVAFLWLSLAVVIDAMDGALARLVRVKEVLPVFDGPESLFFVKSGGDRCFRLFQGHHQAAGP